MTLKRILAAVVALAMSNDGAAQVRELVGARFDARVTSVIDGDTVDLIPAGEKRTIRVRLEGMDAPERGEPFNDAARRLTRVLVFDQRVRVEGRDVDRYGRLVARVIASGKDVSVELIRSGLACHYTRYSSDPLLAKSQAQAQGEGQGFWARSAAKPRCTRKPAR